HQKQPWKYHVPEVFLDTDKNLPANSEAVLPCRLLGVNCAGTRPYPASPALRLFHCPVHRQAHNSKRFAVCRRPTQPGVGKDADHTARTLLAEPAGKYRPSHPHARTSTSGHLPTGP